MDCVSDYARTNELSSRPTLSAPASSCPTTSVHCWGSPMTNLLWRVYEDNSKTTVFMITGQAAPTIAGAAQCKYWRRRWKAADNWRSKAVPWPMGFAND